MMHSKLQPAKARRAAVGLLIALTLGVTVTLFWAQEHGSANAPPPLSPASALHRERADAAQSYNLDRRTNSALTGTQREHRAQL
jgi:hypothetical protein